MAQRCQAHWWALVPQGGTLSQVSKGSRPCHLFKFNTYNRYWYLTVSTPCPCPTLSSISLLQLCFLPDPGNSRVDRVHCLQSLHTIQSIPESLLLSGKSSDCDPHRTYHAMQFPRPRPLFVHYPHASDPLLPLTASEVQWPHTRTHSIRMLSTVGCYFKLYAVDMTATHPDGS